MASAKMTGLRDLSTSRLWAGVPQITIDNIRQYDPAYQGHSFLFVTNVPVFMQNTDIGKIHCNNLRAIIERATTAFSGQNNITANFADQVDGYSDRKLSNVTSVVKDIDEVTIKCHEFKGLILKQAIEYWLLGIDDIKSHHCNYAGLVSSLGVSLKNHTMGVLVCQTDPGWYEIQDSAWYHNMIPVEVPFNSFDWTKGEVNIVEDYDLRFKCNEERSTYVDDVSITYMNSKILNNLAAYYDSKKFNPKIPVPTA